MVPERSLDPDLCSAPGFTTSLTLFFCLSLHVLQLGGTVVFPSAQSLRLPFTLFTAPVVHLCGGKCSSWNRKI